MNGSPALRSPGTPVPKSPGPSDPRPPGPSVFQLGRDSSGFEIFRAPSRHLAPRGLAHKAPPPQTLLRFERPNQIAATVDVFFL